MAVLSLLGHDVNQHGEAIGELLEELPYLSYLMIDSMDLPSGRYQTHPALKVIGIGSGYFAPDGKPRDDLLKEWNSREFLAARFPDSPSLKIMRVVEAESEVLMEFTKPTLKTHPPSGAQELDAAVEPMTGGKELSYLPYLVDEAHMPISQQIFIMGYAPTQNPAAKAAEELARQGVALSPQSRTSLKELLDALVDPQAAIAAARDRFEEPEEQALFDALLRTVAPEMAERYLPAQTWVAEMVWNILSQILPASWQTAGVVAFVTALVESLFWLAPLGVIQVLFPAELSLTSRAAFLALGGMSIRSLLFLPAHDRLSREIRRFSWLLALAYPAGLALATIAPMIGGFVIAGAVLAHTRFDTPRVTLRRSGHTRPIDAPLTTAA